MLSSSSSSAGRGARRSTMSSSSSSARPRASSGSSSSLKVGPAVVSLISPSPSCLVARVDLLGGRALRQHRLEIEDLAQLHRAFVEGVRPFDDRVEGDRAFAQAPDHRVAAGLDALGDGDLALAGEQFDRAHLAQVHAHRVVGAVDRFLLGRDARGAGRRRRADRPLPRARRPRLPRRRRESSFSTMLTPISLIADMMSSICSEVIWSCGSASLSSS